jgi:hypothetical protein
MNTIFILGENSFLAKHLYILIKKQAQYNVILLNHHNYHEVKTASNHDIIINFCGINRSSSKEDYEQSNHYFLKDIINCFTCQPFFIHISSLMVYGFQNKKIDELNNYQKWFIESKLNGEQYLSENYPENLLCIIRPSNIYGYDCTPYYNNLLSSLVYEKICGLNKINNININCVRNVLSVEKFSYKLYEFMNSKKYGKYNIMSNNTESLEKIVAHIYDDTIPEHILLNKGELDIPNTDDNIIKGINIIIEENLQNQIKLLEEQMKIFINLKENVHIKKLNMLIQPRGNMVEITDLNSKRLYKITLTKHSVRGNHYHYEQIEDFYTNQGKVLYLFAYSDSPIIVYQYISYENDLMSVKPTIIHTLTNDFLNNNPEIIISSTQKFVENEIPDTKYINII